MKDQILATVKKLQDTSLILRDLSIKRRAEGNAEAAVELLTSAIDLTNISKKLIELLPAEKPQESNLHPVFENICNSISLPSKIRTP